MSSPRTLAATLSEVTPAEYVRFVADWMTDADELNEAPALTGEVVIDALVAAATTEVTVQRDLPIPAWTEEPERTSPTLWYRGPNGLLPNALVHSPLSFVLHGVLVEADSLVSV